MNRSIPLLVLACTLAASSSLAQEDTKTVKVRRFVEVSGRAALGKAMAERALKKILRTDADRPLWPGFAEAFVNTCEPAAITSALVTVYSGLDEATLDAAIAFYSTPAGKELAELQTQHDVALQDALEAWIETSVKTALATLGMPSAKDPLGLARRRRNETGAIDALKVLTEAQDLFREGDKDVDGEFQYAPSLAALSKTQLIDDVLGSGTKQAYRFELINGSVAPKFLWAAVASPVNGEGCHFIVNQEGVIYYSTHTPFTLDRKTCTIRDGATPVGR